MPGPDSSTLHTIRPPTGGYRSSGIPVVRREDFSDVTYLLEIEHPMMARAARPGQFVIVMARDEGERIQRHPGQGVHDDAQAGRVVADPPAAPISEQFFSLSRGDQTDKVVYLGSVHPLTIVDMKD